MMLLAARPASNVFDVGSDTVDVAVVARREGQLPDFLVHGLAGLDQPLGQLVIVGEETGAAMTQGHDYVNRDGQPFLGLARFSHTGSDFSGRSAGRITEGLKERRL
jgi:hypothetical protein